MKVDRKQGSFTDECQF